jgi:hypothetical protein
MRLSVVFFKTFCLLYTFIRLRQNTLYRAVAKAAMARRRLATGMNGEANRVEAR